MITVADICLLHELSIQKYGGAAGIRYSGMLESAVARFYQTFGGDDLYPHAFEKAAAIIESIIINHPFVDGNKRTGFLAMFAMLKEENFVLAATPDNAYDFTISISTGTIHFDEIVNWLKSNTSKL